MLRFLFQMAALAAVCLWAFRSGGRPERQGAAILLGMLALQLIVMSIPAQRDYWTVETGLLIVDTLALMAMLVLALTADRFWPLCLAAFQLLSCVTHVLRMISMPMEPMVYAIMNRGPSYGLIAVLAFGVWNHRRKTRRNSPTNAARR